jgi:tetratricopeptide (TPR) repeat protein
MIGCTTTLKVVTQPEQTSVYVIAKESGEKRKIGLTPIEKKSDELKEIFAGVGKPGELVALVFEKEEYITRELWMPLSSSGIIASDIQVQMKKNDKSIAEMKTAKEILDKMFLAQRFARTKQFERALIEIEKVIETFPNFGRALSMKGSIFYAKGDFKESLVWYEKAITIDSELRDAVEMAANVRKKLRLPASALPKK